MAAEIQLPGCGYPARCTVRGCFTGATMLPATPTTKCDRSGSASCASATRSG
jgi:hypothetical protein